ncbi:TPA: hypothetical protein ACKPET_000321 [Pseudomonas aeruginosa]
MRAALDFIAPDGTAEQLESEACIEWRQQDADFLEAGLYAFCAEYPEEGGVLLDEEPTTAQPSPLQSEQAEAERPEVVAYFDRNYPSTGDAFIWSNYEGSPYEPVMTVAQHERIVVAEKGKTAAAMLESHRQFVRQFEEGTAELIAQRDAALARVAELERQEPVALANRGLHAFWVKWTEAAAGLYGPGIKLYAAPVAQAQQLNDLDKQCRDDVARALGLRPNQERGFAWSYLLASIKSCVKASGDSAQAQHSVPDGAADLCRFLAKLYCELDGLRYSTAKLPAEQIADALIFKWPVLQGARNQLNIKRISEQPYDESKLHSAIAAMLAAAPDKEVPQAWLDVQAERRRQIEAEGWTPEHDDLYCAAELPRAAAAYILNGANDEAPAIWPFVAKWWKPRDARSNYVRAGALILAEIERLDRAAPGKEVGHE